MSQLDSPEIEKLILERLKNNDKMDDIIMEVCEKTNVSWEEVRAHIEGESIEHEEDITLFQSPVIIAISLATFTAGAFLVYFMPSLELLFVGISMIIGGMTGMQDIWKAVLKKTGIL
jgi:hypothetical protein